MMNKDDLLKQKAEHIENLIHRNPDGVEALKNSGATYDGLKELSSGNLAFLLSSKEDVIELCNSGVMFDTLKELDLEKTSLLLSYPKNVGKLIQCGFTSNDLKELDINFLKPLVKNTDVVLTKLDAGKWKVLGQNLEGVRALEGSGIDFNNIKNLDINTLSNLVTLPPLEAIENQYKHEASIWSTSALSMFSKKSPADVVIELRQRANRNPEGASAKTLDHLSLNLKLGSSEDTSVGSKTVELLKFSNKV